MVRLVRELPSHVDAREELLDAAFGPARFTKTSERLREDRLPANGLSFVAVDGQRLVGTVRLWNVAAGPGRSALLLGPLAVAEGWRSRGLGSALMQRALTSARLRGHSAVILVGDEPYYARFGFRADLTTGLWLPGPFERNRFLGLELAEGGLSGAIGLVSPTGASAPKPGLAELVAAASLSGDFARAA